MKGCQQFCLIYSCDLYIFIKKLYLLRKEVKIWEKGKNEESLKYLELLEWEIENLQGQVDEDYFFIYRKERRFYLQSHKAKILRQIKETWCLKSRSMWLKASDNNMKFFHRHAN